MPAHPTNSHSVAHPCRTPQGRAVGRGRAPNPRRPTHGQEAPPQGTLMPPPQRATPACRSARCGVGDGSPRPQPPHAQPVRRGPCRTPQGRGVGRGSVPNPRCSTRRQEAPTLGALLPPEKRAKPALKSARCGVGDGSPCPNPPHQQPVDSTPRPHTLRTGGRARESTEGLDAPHPGKRRPSPGRPGAVFQPAKPARKSARCGIHPPPPAQPVGSRPRPHAPRTSGRATGSVQPQTPYTKARDAPPPRCPCAAPTARKASSQGRALWSMWGGDQWA